MSRTIEDLIQDIAKKLDVEYIKSKSECAYILKASKECEVKIGYYDVGDFYRIELAFISVRSDRKSFFDTNGHTRMDTFTLWKKHLHFEYPVEDLYQIISCKLDMAISWECGP